MAYAVLAWWLVFFVPECASGGRTVGKALFGIAVRNRDDGAAVGRGRLARREWFRAWRMALVVAGCSTTSTLARGYAHHDRATRTVVVREPWTLGSVAIASGTTAWLLVVLVNAGAYALRTLFV